MEHTSHNPLLMLSEDEMHKIRKSYTADDTKLLEEKVIEVKEWCQKQDHLAEAFRYFNTRAIERLLILSKGSVEMTKMKIDKLLTTRGMLPEFCLGKSYKEFEPLFEKAVVVPLAKLNPSNQTRCVVVKTSNDFFDDFTLLQLLRYTTMFTEFRLLSDYSVADVIISDMQNVNLSFLPKLNAILYKKLQVLSSEGYGYKVKGIYILNAPSFIDKIMAIIRPFLKEKVASRLKILSSIEDLHKEVPKEILPEDYGGDQPSLAKQAGEWMTFMQSEEGEKQIELLNKLISDESKRNCFKFNEEYLGMPGSFRKLTVD